MNQHQEKYSGVVIVGGGPVGLALALTLARYGVRSLVLEKREMPTVQDQSRAITWMPRGLEFADWLGITPQLLQRGVIRTAHQFWGKKPLLQIPFKKTRSPHPYTLQLPQHDTEVILEEQARETGLVEIRRAHTVVGIQQDTNQAIIEVESSAGCYVVTAPWAVGCDGAQSHVRKWLGIEQTWQDYGTYSAVADVEMTCDMPETTSRIVLDPARPYGFFYFAPGRWRMIYRINKEEDRHVMTTERQVLALLRAYLPHATLHRFLWASAFRLGQGQCVTYHKERWILAGDAAHAMGPSAGAGMMVGLLGVWRLGWRLALLMHNPSPQMTLLEDYSREQQAASRAVQMSNALIFRNLRMKNVVLARLRSVFLQAVGHLDLFSRQLLKEEALVEQVLPVLNATDVPEKGEWNTCEHLGDWHVGQRIPYQQLADRSTTLDLVKLNHLLIPIGRVSHTHEEEEFAQDIEKKSIVPLTAMNMPEEVAASWRVVSSKYIAFALVRPDQHIVRIFMRKSFSNR